MGEVTFPPEEAARRARNGHLAMLVFSGLVAGSFSLGGMVANEIAPVALNWARFCLAFVVVWVLALATGQARMSAYRAPWRYMVLGGLFAIYFVLMFVGLKTATPVSTAAVFTLTPAMSAVAGWVLMRQRTTSRMTLALLVGAAGALWVIFRADFGRMMAFQIGWGEFVFFWGCLAHAIYTPMIRFLNRGEGPFAVNLGMAGAVVLILTAYGWNDIRSTDWAALPGMVWVTIGYTAVFAGAVTFTLLMYASQRLPSAKVMAYTYLTPTWVAIWEFALGHEVPSLLVLAGVGLTIVALLMLLKQEE